MDIARPELKRHKKIERYAYAGVGVFLIIGVTSAVSRLKPAAPNVDRATIWTGTVKRGPWGQTTAILARSLSPGEKSS